MIDVIVTGCLAGYEARAEAPDPESAVVAARTLWDDAQDAALGYVNRCVIVFKVDGKTVMRAEPHRRP
jgi:hypothetical protein